jgi:hypothetical protein
MKTTDFIKESIDQAEYNDEAGMAKNSLHTIIRVATHLERELGDNENLPAWVQEKIGAIKQMMVTVMDYMISQHEMGKKEEMPSFDPEQAFREAMEQGVAEGVGDWMGKMADKAFGPGSPTEIAGFAGDKDYAQHYDTKAYPAAIQAIAQGGGVGSTLTPNRNTNAEVARAKSQLAHILRAKGVKIDPSNYDELITNKIKADVAKAMGQQSVAEGSMKGPVTEDAGVTGSSSIAVTPQTLGEKGSFSKKDVNKKLSGYGNVLKRGTNNVKVKGGY